MHVASLGEIAMLEVANFEHARLGVLSQCYSFRHFTATDPNLFGLSPDYDKAFAEPLAPKWDEKKDDRELIDNPALNGWDLEKSKAAYERGMFPSVSAVPHRAQNRRKACNRICA
jgi:hypothetical protein